MANNEQKRPCPCCGYNRVGVYEICSVCGWANDPLAHLHPALSTHANPVSLEEARRNWAASLEPID